MAANQGSVDAVETGIDEDGSKNKDGVDGDGSKRNGFNLWKLNLLLSIFKFASTTDKILIGISIVANCCAGFLLPLFMLFFGNLINGIGGDPMSSKRDANFYVALMTVVGGISFTLNWIGGSTMEWAAESQLLRIREKYLKALVRQDVGWFDQHDGAALSSRLNENCVVLRESLGAKFGQIFMFVTMFVGGFTIGYVRGPKLAAVMTASLPFLAVSAAFMMYSLSSASKIAREAYSKAGAIAEESFSSIRTLTAFGGQQSATERYDTCLAAGSAVKQLWWSSMGMSALLGIMFLTYALGFWFGGTLVATDLENGCNVAIQSCFRGGDALTVFFNIVIAAFVVGQAGPSVSAFFKGVAAADDVGVLLDRVSPIDPYSEDGIKDVSLKGDIEFKNVKFAFPSRSEKPVFAELNLKIPAGQRVALVGASGCGKSSAVQLLQRFYDVDGGAVEIDGRDLRQYNVKWIRSQMSIVSQEPRLFADTISENIRFGRLEATEEEIRDAAKRANALKFIEEFPGSFDTRVGEAGGQLSGGQKQRVAIARAVIRDPKILILDEATSALDNESEKVVQNALDQLIDEAKRTTIIIAHRLTTIRNADKIVVLDNTSGEGAIVVENGSHTELMAIDGGLYRNLVESQTVDVAAAKADLLVKRLSSEFETTVARVRTTSTLRDHSILSLSAKYSSMIGAFNEANPKEEEEEEEKKKKKKSKKDQKGPSFFRVVENIGEDWWKLAVGSVGALLNGATFPVFAVIFSQFVGVYFLPDPAEIRRQSTFWAGIFVALAASAFVSMSVQFVFFGWAGVCLVRRVRKKTFYATVTQDIGFFDDPENATGNLSTVLSSDAMLLKGWVSDNTGILLQNLATLVYALIISFVASPQLAAVTLAGFMILAPAAYLEMLSMKGTGDETESAAESPGYILNETISGIRVVAAFSLQDEIRAKYTKVLADGLKAGKKRAITFGLFFGFSQGAQFLVQALAFWYGNRLLNEGKIRNASTMLMAIFALIFAGMGLGQSAIFATDTKKAGEAAKNIYALLDRVPAIDVKCPDGEEPSDVKGTIDLNKLNFRYPQRLDVPVYKDVRFKIKEGETVAIVGASGCGKSTIIQLLERFYDVQSRGGERYGGISIGGIDIRDFRISHLRAQLGLVSQEPVLFDTTIKENILFGKSDATMDQIVEAAKMSNCHDFIMGFPDGYETVVGKGGGKLSGGQKQRVSIARAILRSPKILLLDEATSALDAESEKAVQSALDRLLQERARTTIVIAHRLSTVRNADKIIVLSNEDNHGSVVVETGDHDSLMRKENGVYAGLVRIAGATGNH